MQAPEGWTPQGADSNTGLHLPAIPVTTVHLLHDAFLIARTREDAPHHSAPTRCLPSRHLHPIPLPLGCEVWQASLYKRQQRAEEFVPALQALRHVVPELNGHFEGLHPD